MITPLQSMFRLHRKEMGGKSSRRIDGSSPSWWMWLLVAAFIMAACIHVAYIGN